MSWGSDELGIKELKSKSGEAGHDLELMQAKG
jgi:hypothetical protein